MIILVCELQDYDLSGTFDNFWRVRLDMMRVVLLDESGIPIPSPGSEFGGYIRVGITYPTTFNDTNYKTDKLAFLAQDFFCMAEYSTNGEGITNFCSSLFFSFSLSFIICICQIFGQTKTQIELKI